MGVLNAWQRIDRVLAGKPFGDYVAGDASLSSIPTVTVDSVAGTADSYNLTTSNNTFANGDLILIHQSRGTNYGQNEYNRVVAGGGTTSLTLQKPLKYTYTDSGDSQAQAVKVTRYRNLEIDGGTWTQLAWDGNINALLSIAAKKLTIQSGAGITGKGKGFRGGAHAGDPGTSGGGESGSANPGSQASGAGQAAVNSDYGYGGGYGTAGGAGVSNKGGNAHGSADLTVFDFGGGGSGANANPSSRATDGAPSGAGLTMCVKELIIVGTINENGNDSPNGQDRTGGGGSGGFVLIVCETASLGSNKITALGGVAGSASSGTSGTDGGVGRIAVHHSKEVTGTTLPAFEDILDITLVERTAGFFQFIN